MMEFVNGKDDIPYMKFGKYSSHVNQSTNQNHIKSLLGYIKFPKDPWCWNIYQPVGITWKITLGVNF